MSKLGLSLVVASAIPLFASGSVRAASGSLLVVVESAPGTDVGPADVRQAIATELQAPVVAPRDPAAGDSERLLVVALDASAIRMSLRMGTNQAVTRAIPAPLERPARLRAIGWLAGNLARDQVSGIVDAPSALPPSQPPTIAAADPSPPLTQPPRALPAPPSTPAPPVEATIATRATPPVTDGYPRWALTATGGPTFVLDATNSVKLKSYQQFRDTIDGPAFGSVYQVTLLRRSSADGLIFGAALDIGQPIPNGGNLVAVAALIGTRWDHRRWFLETSGGLGLELVRLPVRHYSVTASSSGGLSSELITTNDEQLALYAYGAGAIGVPVSRLFDVLAQLNLHLTSAGDWTNFLSASFGVRLRLP